MHERFYVVGKNKRAFIKHIVRKEYIGDRDVFKDTDKDEAVKKAGLADAIFFRAFYYNQPWHVEYLKMVARNYRVAIYNYDNFRDKGTHKKIV